jgi:hypothetical protein
MLDQSVDDGLSVFASELDQHDVAGLPLYQRGDLAITIAKHQVAFPVSWNGAILCTSGTFTDRYRSDNATVVGSFLRVVTRSAHSARASKVFQQLLFQGPTCMDIKRAVARLV